MVIWSWVRLMAVGYSLHQWFSQYGPWFTEWEGLYDPFRQSTGKNYPHNTRTVMPFAMCSHSYPWRKSNGGQQLLTPEHESKQWRPAILTVTVVFTSMHSWLERSPLKTSPMKQKNVRCFIKGHDFFSNFIWWNGKYA